MIIYLGILSSNSGEVKFHGDQPKNSDNLITIIHVGRGDIPMCWVHFNHWFVLLIWNRRKEEVYNRPHQEGHPVFQIIQCSDGRS